MRKTKSMNQITRCVLGAATLAMAFVATASLAQQPQPPTPTVRVRGQIEEINGDLLNVKSRDGAHLKVKMSDNYRVAAMIKATLDELKPDTYIGVTSMPQSDGSLKAIAIHIFQPNQRGTGEGHRPWDLMQGSLMTNAAIDTTVAAADGQTITVKYKQGDKVDEKKVLITPQTVIVRYVPGEKAELKPGVHIIIGAATKKEDGSLEAPALNYGRDGIVPPM
jgi:hypothetical protein